MATATNVSRILTDMESSLATGEVTERHLRYKLWYECLDEGEFDETELETALEALPNNSLLRPIVTHLLAAYRYDFKTNPEYKGENEVVLPDGTRKWSRLEHPTDVNYGVTIFPDGSSHHEHAELANGELQVNSYDDCDGHLVKAEYIEIGTGEKHYGLSVDSDGNKHYDKVVLPDGEVLLDVTV
jgi:hypothetical protein